jgi:hypothetical protein
LNYLFYTIFSKKKLIGIVVRISLFNQRVQGFHPFPNFELDEGKKPLDNIFELNAKGEKGLSS